MKIVLDTNVIVSGLLSPFGSPAEIVRLVASGELELLIDTRILAEYRSVLLRPKFPFEPIHVDALLDQIQAKGHPVVAEPLVERLSDRDDEVFLEVALSGRARCLVTGNLKHYPIKARQGMRIASPSEFLEIYRQEKKKLELGA